MPLNLDQIEKVVSEDPQNTSLETRRRFWRIVREIKRNPHPDAAEVKQAARIRNMLFRAKRGRTYPLWPCVALFALMGILGPTVWYLRLLDVPLRWNALLIWTTSDWWTFVRRLGSLAAATFFFYPLGRLIGGRWAGIQIDGMSRGMYSEPTLKIDYESFLLARPYRRKWFFFFAGSWTIITSFLVGLVGLILAGDLCGVVIALFLSISEGLAIWSGTTRSIGGEMAHFNRERKIEQEWKPSLGE